MNKLLIALLASVSIMSVAHAAGDAAAGQGKQLYAAHVMELMAIALLVIS